MREPGFHHAQREARSCVHYQPVVDQVLLPSALDPVWVIVYAIFFSGIAIATARRAAYGVAALILVQPFALAHYVLGTTITLPKVALLAVLFGLSTRAGWSETLRKRPVRTILIALGILVAVVAVTSAGAAYPGAAVRESFKWLEYLLLFTAVCVAYRRDPDDGLLIACWVAIALVVAAFALLQEGLGAPSGLSLNGEIVPRIAGPLQGPNQLAGYLEIALAALCAWYGRNRFIPFIVVVVICTLALTFSRGGIAGATIVVVVISAARPQLRRPLVTPVAIGALFGGTLVGAWTWISHIPGALPRLPSPSYAGGVGHRRDLWRAAIELWQRRPLLGVGAGNYERELAQVGLTGVRTHANSWYLQALAEGGIALFGATLALLGTILVSLARRMRDGSPWQLAAFAASLALAIHQSVDYLVFYPKIGGPWWILVALGASALAMRESAPGVAS